jgi:TonB family protein
MKVMNWAVIGFVTIYGSHALAQPVPPTPTSQVASAVGAETITDPVVAYKAYSDALNANRLTDAASYGAQAWQLAETKWGATNANLGPLAYNAAWSAALVGKSSQRLDAARRAVELASNSTAAYTLPEAQFLLAYAEYFATPEKDRAIAAPKLAAAAMAVEPTWNDYLIINALVTSATLGAEKERGRRTIEVAERALTAIDRISPDDKESRVMALFARAKGRMVASSNLDEALADIIQARVTYGPIRTVDDKTWGTLAAWESAARAVVLTVRAGRVEGGTRISQSTRRLLEMTPAQKRIVYARLDGDPTTPEQCDGVLRDRSFGSEISYPTGEANNFRVAGVVVRVDMDAQGKVFNPRVLGAVPTGRFSDNALAAVRGWRYRIPPDAPASCAKDHDIMVSFAIG